MTTPSTAPSQTPPLSPALMLISGISNVKVDPTVVTQKGAASELIDAKSVNWAYATPVAVSLAASIKDTAMNSEARQFGIVQNKTGGAVQ